MSEVNADDITGFEMDCGKRETKLTAKALASKIESLQMQRKSNVNKIKSQISEIKNLMKRKENVSVTSGR